MLIECDICNAVIQTVEIGSFADNRSEDLLEGVLYTLCKCPQCFSPILVQQERDYDGLDLFWGNKRKIFPNTLFHINPIIPEQLKKALQNVFNVIRLMRIHLQL